MIFNRTKRSLLRQVSKKRLIKKRKKIVKRVEQSLRSRHRAGARYLWAGRFAVMVSVAFLALLIGTVFYRGISAFTTTYIQLNVTFAADEYAVGEPASDTNYLKTINYSALVKQSLAARFEGKIASRRDKAGLYGLVSKYAPEQMRSYLADNPDALNQTRPVWLLASSTVDLFIKHGTQGRLTPKQQEFITSFEEDGHIKTSFNTLFFTQADSREPEIAGILGSFIGSILVILTCMAVAFPLGVMAAIYLEEFAPKNMLTRMLEVNINNLAAVPSIIFGLLGLAVYLQLFGMPRSSALVGGVTLAMMALPVIVIATRTSLATVPPSIRQAALALGATKVQTTFDHVLPLALPGIMTGAILSVARILGETAPLLMIGMVAFIVDVPKTIFEPATSLPVQIYLWADSPEAGFVEKTSAGIMVLLVVLVLVNLLAIILRKKYQQKW